MPRSPTIWAAVAAFLAFGLWNAVRPAVAGGEPGPVAQARLAALPQAVGAWQGRDLPTVERTMRATRAEAFLSRAYTNPATGETVTVLILYGDPGDLGAHDPGVCYVGAGFEAVGSSTKAQAGGFGEFWSARFAAPAAAPLEVRWAWGTGAGWQAPDTARLAFARHGRIYKLYAQQTLRDPPPGGPPGTPLDRFLPAFLPELRKALTDPRPSPDVPPSTH